MPFSFTIFGSGTILLLLGVIVVVNLCRKLFGRHTH
jgi:hypothetical protein